MNTFIECCPRLPVIKSSPILHLFKIVLMSVNRRGLAISDLSLTGSFEKKEASILLFDFPPFENRPK